MRVTKALLTIGGLLCAAGAYGCLWWISWEVRAFKDMTEWWASFPAIVTMLSFAAGSIACFAAGYHIKEKNDAR